jgi:CubicO group peptidase (beta-lactamase class C family)
VLAVLVSLAAIAGCGSSSRQGQAWANDPQPRTLAEFEAGARQILQDTGVAGAGLALVRQDAVEWVGGIGYADRETPRPVTADTHFRVGGIGKTFVATALVQLYEDGDINLHAPVAEIAPEIAIDNPWEESDPVLVIHLLQHTAGLDDMHVTDGYMRDGGPELSLRDVLALNPASRRVRWRPGTRVAYSHVGYGVAAAVLEAITGESFEAYVKREIFEPLGMISSGFRIDEQDAPLMALGYDGAQRLPVGIPRVHLRPALNMHASPRDLSQFVRMLLGWGELGSAFIVDPEYLSNMELPQTTAAADAGMRNGYGSGIATTLTLPFRVLGYDGDIDGFSSTYGYSSSRDVGFVVLLNSSGGRAHEARVRLSALALRYLKRDVEPPAKPAIALDHIALEPLLGYYQDANPRRALTWPIEWLWSGRTIALGRDGSLVERRPFRTPVALVAVTDSSFRTEEELDASRILTTATDGTVVLVGSDIYAERVPRWRIEVVRVPLIASGAILLSTIGIAPFWIVGAARGQRRGFWPLKLVLLGCGVAPVVAAAAVALTPPREWHTANAGTICLWAATIALPALTGTAALMALRARSLGAGWPLVAYGMLVTLSATTITTYLALHGLLGLRLWKY